MDFKFVNIYTSEIILNILTLDRGDLNCVSSEGSIWDAARRSILFSIVRDKTPSL